MSTATRAWPWSSALRRPAGDRHLRRGAGPRSRRRGATTSDRFSTARAKELPRGSQIVVRGQIETMRTSFLGLLAGLALAIVLVYLLIVVNFQSWLDPFIIISALPAALAGIVWMLFLTAHDVQRAGADRRDHVHGRRDREQHPGRQLREGRARRAARGASTRRSTPGSRASGRC